MIRSMTAYGRAKETVGGKTITVEIRAVNNRYLDCTVKIPRLYISLEEKIKTYIQSAGVVRGKVDIFVTVEMPEGEISEVIPDLEYAKSYIGALQRLRDTFSLKDDITVMTVAQNRDIFRFIRAEEDTERDWADFLAVLSRATEAFLAARAAEGSRLLSDVREKMERIKTLVADVETAAAATTEAYEARLRAKLRATLDEYGVRADDNRILTECALFADRIAIDEELVRLRSHFAAFEDILRAEDPAGRKLDFLLQEINRETNTIGSKAQNAGVAKTVVEIKSELEKIREQIQNLE